MKKITILLVTMFVAFTNYAQTSLYEKLKQNGSDAEYKEFYRVSKGEKAGTTKIDGESKWLTASIDVAENGVKTGFTLTKTDGSGEYGISLMYRTMEAKGYPNVSYIYDKDNGNGYIIVDDYIMNLEGVSADGTSFKDIKRIFVKKQVKAKKETSSKVGEKKKSKFLAGLKDVATKAISSGSDGGSYSLEAKKASSEDLFQIATDYLKAMKAKHANYSLTSADKADLEKIKSLIDNQYKKVNKANSDYWQSEEGQRVLNKSSSSSNEYYYVKNSTNTSVQIGNGSTNHLNSGSTFKVKCGTPIYRYQLNSSKTTWSKGSMISDGKNVCGKTVNY